MKHGKHSLTFAFPILLKMALYRKKRFTRKIVSDHMKELILFLQKLPLASDETAGEG